MSFARISGGKNRIVDWLKTLDRQELLNKFSFTTDGQALRERRQSEVLRLPSSVPPMFEMAVVAVRQTGLISLPFTASITAGLRSW